MPTAQARLRAVSPCRNGALRPYPASASTQPKRTPAAIARSISAKAISGLDRGIWYSTGTPARLKRTASLVQLSGRNSRNVSMTGTSPRASVSDTRVWQLAVLRNTDWLGAFLSYCSVINHQHRIAAPDQPIVLDQQLSFQGRCIPDPGGDEVMQLIVVARCQPLRHRLNALAVPGTDQP